MARRIVVEVERRGCTHSHLPTLSFLLLRNRNHYSFSSLHTYFSMEKQSEERDQKQEGIFKGAFDSSTPKHELSSDDILPHILNLYGSAATPKDFEIYAPEATFEDPLMCAHGIKQIKSAFYSLPKLFSESKIVEYNVKENIISTERKEILIDNKQHYKLFGKEIDMISLIKLYVEEGKVVRHEDWWDKKPLINRETAKISMFGQFIEYSRRGSMMATHALMGFGKDPVT